MSKLLKHLAIAVSVLAALLTPLAATEFTPTITASCSSFSVSATGFIATQPGDTYGLRYWVRKWPAGETFAAGTIPIPVSPSFPSQTVPFSVSTTGSAGPLVGDFSFTAEAILTINGVDALGSGPVTVAPVSCPVNTGGCPGTPGYWKNVAKHPFPSSIQASGLSIGGVTYTAAQLLQILGSNGGDAIAILGRQLVAASINKVAGAISVPSADVAITTANALLAANNLNLLTSSVGPSTTLGQALIFQSAILGGYNNGNNGTCVEGTGLVLRSR